MTSKQRAQSLRVGLFVFAALGVLVAAVFVIGQERSMFARKTRVYTSFRDINGLVIGAPVRLAGVDVGRVTKISFSDDIARAEAHIQLSIEDEYMVRVRKDSRAYIDSKGLLGDKLINISVGSAKQPQLQEGGYVLPRQGVSLEAMAEKFGNAASSVGHAADTAADKLNEVVNPQLGADLRRISASLASLLEQVEHGDGVAHRMFYDAKYAKQVGELLDNLERASASAASAAAHLDNVLARVEHGPGTLHSLAYSADGEQMVGEWKRAATGVADVAEHVNRGDGLAGALLTDEQGKKLVVDLAEMMDRLNRISRDVERGRGTVGGLLVDPSVYEDMKTVLGNIERNTVFKTLVRMTIKEDGIKRPAQPPRAHPAD